MSWDRLRALLVRRNHLWGHILFTLASTSLASVVLTWAFHARGLAAHDVLWFFSCFHDLLHALNVTGEFPWWHPRVQMGFPFYYLLILGWHALDPVIIILGAGVWLLGRLGIVIPSYLHLYILYWGFLIPVLLGLSLLALARPILRHPLAIYFVIVLAAFAPVVVYSISDPGAERVPYGFFWAGAFLGFVRRPSRSRFLLLAVCMLLLAVTVNQLWLFWNALFVPLFAVVASVGADGLRPAVRRALVAVPLWAWLLLAAGTLACLSPALVTYSQGVDIVRAGQADRVYDYSNLRPGNPMELLTVSTPGIGYDWDRYDAGSTYRVLLLNVDDAYMSYSYLGMLVLPLAGLGLVAGARCWRGRLLASAVVFGTVVILSGWSGLFSLVLLVVWPLRAVNHYSDCLLRIGGYAIYLLAAGLGVEVMCRRRRELLRTFAWIATLCLGLAVAFLIGLQARSFANNFVCGLAVLLALFYMALLWGLAGSRCGARRRAWVVAMMAMSMIDTSTLAFIHTRRVLLTHAERVVEPPPGEIGMGNGSATVHAQQLLHLRGLDRNRRAELAAKLPDWLAVVAEPEASSFASLDAIGGQSTLAYNGLNVVVTTVRPSYLLWRDAMFPFWTARVNGAPAAIELSHGHFKAVKLPPGECTVQFRFRPRWVPESIVLAYGLIAVTAVAWLVAVRRERISSA
jgi:hypothetical protein